MKKCFKCGLKKSLDDFYKHPKMPSGILNKCKDCTKDDVRNNLKLKSLDPVFIEKERERGREKYYRLSYCGKNKPSKESKRETVKRHNEKYPEKLKCKSFLGKKIKPKVKGNHLHHWSYNIQHALDVIELTIQEHNLLHRHIIYDQERKMYRTRDGILLDTKESHLILINNLK